MRAAKLEMKEQSSGGAVSFRQQRVKLGDREREREDRTACLRCGF